VAFCEPVFSLPPSVPFYYLMRLYNRRFARMGRSRRSRNQLGNHNAGRRFLFPGYTFEPASAVPILKALVQWGRLELAEGWRSWFDPKAKTQLVIPSRRNATNQSAVQPGYRPLI
ncbi:MAG: hypothetical protein ABI651_13395, partial [Verrucomicrobiota bacterium]